MTIDRRLAPCLALAVLAAAEILTTQRLPAGEAAVVRVADSSLDQRTDRLPESPTGPDELPERLSGIWTVSLCIKTSHAWIRFENAATGEVHTLGSYRKGAGGVRDPRSFHWQHPPVDVTGVHWDIDLRHEPEIAEGNYRLLNVQVTDPEVFRGYRNGFGHGGYRNNCTTYARDAWHFYSRQWYDLPFVETPKSLYDAVCKRYADE